MPSLPWRTTHVRKNPLVALAGAFAFSQVGLAQVAAPPAVGNQPSDGNQGLRNNTYEPSQPAAMMNKITSPVPLTAGERDAAMAAVDKHLTDGVAALKEKLGGILPDELAVLAKTSGWTGDHQQALVTALCAGDPTAVYEAYSQGNPKDAAGAEIVARQVDVRRTLAKLEQDLQKNQASVSQDIDDIDKALGKISATVPATADVAPMLDTLKNWTKVRTFVDKAMPQKGPIAKLPSGKISLIYDPGTPVGTAVVLGNDALLIGNQGRGPLAIQIGNAAEALGLPIVTGAPVEEAEGEAMASGVMIVNPKSSRATINYNVNGNHYIMEPGMAQRLPGGADWVVEFDRGQSFGPAAYTLGPGTFYFTPSDQGIQLYEQRFDVTVDNSQNKQEFNALVMGENFTVPAHGARTISSKYPVVVRYDRGNGTQFVSRSMYFSGNVQVGVNSEDNLWDLFPTNDNQRENPKLKLFQ
ncbi:MAG: hypothetical protein QM775_21005 [Pirellulales bacterium]